MLWVHMVCSLLSYAAFLIACVAAVLFLIQERQLKRKQMGALFRFLPSLSVLDRLNFSAIGVGFGLLTVGVVCGFADAKHLLGRWWTGDPKEYLSLLLWGSYLALWVVRLRATLRGRRVALCSVLGFCLVVFTFIGARTLLSSGHPYL